MKATALAGETVDEICWRTLGRTAAVTEQALELNRGLADLGPFLPAGTELILPDAGDLAAATRETVKLWD